MIFLHALQRRFPFAAERGDGLGVIHVRFLLEAMPRQRAIHRAGVHIDVAERLRHELGVRALAARARAVNRYDNGIFRIQNKTSVLVQLKILYANCTN